MDFGFSACNDQEARPENEPFGISIVCDMRRIEDRVFTITCGVVWIGGVFELHCMKVVSKSYS